MTATATAPAWDAQLKELKSRFPAVRDTILFCFHALTQDPDADFEALKEQANGHGLRITNASVNGAKRLVANSEAAPRAKATKTEPDEESPAPTRRPRAAVPGDDAEILVRGLVGKLQARSSAEADKMRDAMRRAIKILTDAAGD
jgi:hypothetical protein